MERLLLIIAAGMCAAAMFMVLKNMKTPPGLGFANGRLAPLPATPNAVSSQAENADRRVEPLPFKEDLDATKAAVREALKAYGGIEIVREEEHYIHAVAATRLMRYRDDLEFYFDEAAGVVHFRSASRVGYSDRGVNRKRHIRLAELYTLL